MAKALLLEFPNVTRADYDAVNDALGLDMEKGTGDWPAGMISHTGGATASGAFAVFEVWESQEAQQDFMNSRLGPALGKVGVAEPTRADWFDVWGNDIRSEWKGA